MTLSGNAYIFVPVVTGISRVVFSLDGAVRQTENLVPWDFAGTAADGTAIAFDTTTVANGAHTVSASVTYTSGATTTLTAGVGIANATATAAPTVTPAPTATPTATSTAAPTATPAGTDPFSVPFLSRPAHGQIHLSNCSNVTVSGYSFSNIADDAIIIEGCNNVTITGNDFSGDVGAIYALNSTNVTVTYNRFANIGNGTIGSGHSNYVQFNNTWGGYIGHNKGKGGNTEDLISVYQSGGASATSPLVIEYNAFESTNWTSGSGSGSMLGDGGGSHIVVRYNTYLSPGQVGIGVPSGTDIHITDNTLYGATRPSSNVGIYVWNQASTACNSIEIARNQVRWYRSDGVENPYWNAGNCGTVSGESTNNWHASIDPTTLQVTL
jgi:parallel beta-helix repeat protein